MEQKLALKLQQCPQVPGHLLSPLAVLLDSDASDAYHQVQRSSGSVPQPPSSHIALQLYCVGGMRYMLLARWLLQSAMDEPWNWNPYLFILWCLGVVVRNFILFPLRCP
jgi:hypothetical protein